MKKHRVLMILAAAVLVHPARGQSDESIRLHELMQQQFEWELIQFPGRALSRGDDRYADRIADQSIEAIEMRHSMTAENLDLLMSIDRTRLDGQDLINYELFDLTLRNEVNGHRFRTFLCSLRSWTRTKIRRRRSQRGCSPTSKTGFMHSGA